MSYEKNISQIDSAGQTKSFFSNYGKDSINFSSNDVDAVISFFESKGFDKQASISTGTLVLSQAKAEGKPVFDLLESLKNLDKVKLTGLVTAILNNNRNKISVLGFKQDNVNVSFEERNIIE